MARTMSVDLSMTMMAAVPRPDLSLTQRVEIHRQVVAQRRRQAAHRRAAGDDGEQVVPAAAHAAGMRCRSARAAGCTSPLRHCRACSRGRRCRTAWCRCCSAGRSAANQAAPRRRMSGTTAIDLDIVDGGRAAVEADVGRERRLQPRLALLALEAFQQRGFLAADVGAGAVVDVEVEVPAVDVVLADQLGLVGLVDRRLQRARARG